MTEVFWINDAIQIFDFPSAFSSLFSESFGSVKIGPSH